LWDRVTDSLDQIGTLHATDGAAIERYCHLTSQWTEARGFGDVHKLCKLAPILLRIEQEYGLTPSARAGLAVQPRKTEEEMESRYFG
jgi:phage terminase small subunit